METRLVRPTFSISHWYGHIGISKISGPKMAGDMGGEKTYNPVCVLFVITNSMMCMREPVLLRVCTSDTIIW